MNSFYGDECAKHPELAGRRYLPNRACIGCHSERNKADKAKRKMMIDELISAALEAPQTPRLSEALAAMGYKRQENSDYDCAGIGA